MLEYVRRVSQIYVRHLRRIDGRISKGGGWTDVRADRIVSSAVFNFEFELNNETIRLRVLTVDRRPQNAEHAHVEVTPEITAEEIAAGR